MRTRKVNDNTDLSINETKQITTTTRNSRTNMKDFQD